MILGALVDLGADFDAIRKGLATLPLSGGGCRIERREVRRCGIAATKVDVISEAQKGKSDDEHLCLPDANTAKEQPPHKRGGKASSAKSAAHSHQKADAGHGGAQHPHHFHHRSWAEIREILSGGKLPESVVARALDAYRLLAEAESRVHRIPIEEIHFHEVGSADAIFDIAGAFLAMHLLDIGEAHVSPITTGFGTVKTAHGVLPVPAPATAELLAGLPLRRGDIEAELVTPTGAAILRACASGFGGWPEGMRVERAGYGAGGREFPGQMNCLRVFLGTRSVAGGQDRAAPEKSQCGGAKSKSLHPQILIILQTEIDDMSGQVYSHIFDRLFASGALDVTLSPIQMKKNRPGVRIEVLCAPDRQEELAAILLRETTTFGIKIRTVERVCLDRRFDSVETPYGAVRVKIGLLAGEIIKVMPEFEDCRRLADERGAAFLAVHEAAREAITLRMKSAKPF